MNAAMGYRAELARTYLAYALWLERSGKRADSARARELRQSARELAESLGMTALR